VGVVNEVGEINLFFVEIFVEAFARGGEGGAGVEVDRRCFRAEAENEFVIEFLGARTEARYHRGVDVLRKLWRNSG
jgi:hypothetical protein